MHTYSQSTMATLLTFTVLKNINDDLARDRMVNVSEPNSGSRSIPKRELGRAWFFKVLISSVESFW